jgi:hypothetical protein
MSNIEHVKIINYAKLVIIFQKNDFWDKKIFLLLFIGFLGEVINRKNFFFKVKRVY